MTTPGPAPCPRDPLEAYPELRAIMNGSATFRRIADRARLVIGGRTAYLVRGDTLGTLEELFVDALSRGSAPEGADEPSRALFLELPPHLQDVIRRGVRQDPEV